MIDEIKATRPRPIQSHLGLRIVRLALFSSFIFILMSEYFNSLSQWMLGIYGIFVIVRLFFIVTVPRDPDGDIIKTVIATEGMNEKLRFLSLQANDLPMYSVMIPLYQENYSTLKNLARNIAKLSYPPDKLDIMIILEEYDASTISLVKSIDDFPGRILIVPHDVIKTKGRAMNYALLQTKGEFVVVYDAEDIPDMNQLLVALWKFRHSSADLAVIQYRLRFYNRVNSISEFMFTDYEYVFGIRNSVLARYWNFIPLGGTSNHFKTSVLKEVSGWDAYNVTEDAEIAVQIFKKGYKVIQMNLITLEESVVSWLGWIKQRSRWIKGYMQTLYTAICSAVYDADSRRFAMPTSKQIIMCGYFISSLALPMLFIVFSFKLIIILLVYTKEAIFDSYIPTAPRSLALLLQAFLPLVCELGLYFIICRRVGSRPLLGFYGAFCGKFVMNMLYICAFVKALLELALMPSYWDKTYHSGEFIKYDN